MHPIIRPLSLVIATLLVVACNDKGADQTAATEDAPTESVESNQEAGTAGFRSNPDFGSTTRVSREVEGIGSTPQHAILYALESAVSQVNGTRVASQMQGLRSSVGLTADGHHLASVNVDAFLQQVVAGSQGTILGYEILEQQEVQVVDEETSARVRASDAGYTYSASASSSASASGSYSADASASANANAGNSSASASANESASASFKQSGKSKESVNMERGASSYESDHTQRKMRSYWKVRIKADIAQYVAPDEQGRPKIVVAMPRTLANNYAVGDGRVPADEVARAIRARLSDTLTQTKRFIVLDREFGDELQSEIDHINSGNVRLQDTARLGQQLATDLILIPSIERFEYPRHVRKLRMSDREVTSYSGGGRITLRLINATTGEVVMSDSFDHQLSDTGPSTLPRVVNGTSMAQSMMDSLSSKIGTAIVTEIFPVTVVALTGDQVVLSQGGDTLSEGQHWRAVKLGDELRDPQTGRSLGRHEFDCCTIRVDRVSSQTSYGTIVDGVDRASSGFTSGNIELREKSGNKSNAPSPAASRAGQQTEARKAPPKATSGSAGASKPADAASSDEDPNW